MAKRLKQKFYTPPKDDDSEMVVLLKRLGQHIGFLEKKIDMLIEKSGEKNSRGNYSSGSKKPYGSSYGKSRGASRERSYGKPRAKNDGGMRPPRRRSE